MAEGSIGKSLVAVGALVASVMGLTLLWNGCQEAGLGTPPSHFDAGLSLEQAAQMPGRPILVEFYSDSCGACRSVTPLLHDTYQKRLASRLSWVMINADRPQSTDAATLFGVDSLPAVFVFEPARMKKTPIAFESLASPDDFEAAVNAALGAPAAVSSAPRDQSGSTR